MASNSPSLWEDFYNSYINCFAPISSSNGENIHEPDEIKASVEQSVMKFIENGRAMESFFLQKRLLFASQKPELLVMEDINELDQEIKRKDEFIRRYFDKLETWKTMMNASLPTYPSTSGPGLINAGGTGSMNDARQVPSQQVQPQLHPHQQLQRSV